jgi:hypothetical protein
MNNGKYLAKISINVKNGFLIFQNNELHLSQHGRLTLSKALKSIEA